MADLSSSCAEHFASLADALRCWHRWHWWRWWHWLGAEEEARNSFPDTFCNFHSSLAWRAWSLLARMNEGGVLAMSGKKRLLVPSTQLPTLDFSSSSTSIFSSPFFPQVSIWRIKLPTLDFSSSPFSHSFPPSSASVKKAQKYFQLKLTVAMPFLRH